MTFITLLTLLLSMNTHSNPIILFDFNESSNINSWYIVDDVVMGGRSSGNMKLSQDGNGIFEGTVSLENNGGFSSVRHRFKPIDVKKVNTVAIRLKGDGSAFQFRIKNNSSDYYSYIFEFKTSKEWETIYIPLNEMYPGFRGRKLNFPNFDQTSIEEVAFLIANKVPQSFKLEIDKIELVQKEE